MKEALLYRKLPENKVQCRACSHFCLVEEGERGKCGVRENKGGRFYSLVYGQPCALNIDPIEKKPLFHFLPGTASLSLATIGCNFACFCCQNWQISQVMGRSALPQIGEGLPFPDSPLKIVEMAIKQGCPSISYTYTEPTVFLEYALDIMKLAKKAGLKNVWVSNGFFSEETFELILPYLDAANIDLKSFDDEFYKKYCSARLQPVLDNLKRLKQAGVWLEITTLVIPTLSDSPAMLEKIARFIKEDLGPETPWHLLRFFPDISWKLQNLPATPLSTLEAAGEIGQRHGLKNVHLGNV